MLKRHKLKPCYYYLINITKNHYNFILRESDLILFVKSREVKLRIVFLNAKGNGRFCFDFVVVCLVPNLIPTINL